MATIEEQLELERVMLERGADSYLQRNKTAAEQGRGADTDYGRKLMREFLSPIIVELERWKDDKRAVIAGKVRPLLRLIDSEKAIYLGLKCMFNAIHMQEVPIAVAIRVGGMIEDEIRFEKFSITNAEYYQAIRADFQRKGTADYRYKHRVLTHSANEHEDQWEAWDKQIKAEVGMRIMHTIMIVTELFYRKNLQDGLKTVSVLLPTPKAEEWINKHEEFNKFLNPERLPCIIPPDDWTDFKQGGYYSPELRAITPLLMSAKKGQKAFIKSQSGEKLERVLGSINVIQQTAWEVNHEVHAVVKEVWARSLGIGMPATIPLTSSIPSSPVSGLTKDTVLTEEQQSAFTAWKREAASIHTDERERVSKSYQVSRILRLANDFSLRDRFWYVWYCDFRGRLYTATAGFSPQGPDLAKGLIRFATGKPLGPRGLFWLKVHGANRYGYDKGSYEDRAAWVDEHEAEFTAAAYDPISYRHVWANADKPYQFLAFLFEYRDALAHKALGTDYVSRLPIGLDGSCNGLQNFSAMLRDPIGGKATNLVPADRPSDIYAEVARVCTAKIRSAAREGEPKAQQWLDFIDKVSVGSVPVLPRGVAKRPVMTLPYGATPNSCTAYIFDSIKEYDKDFFGKNEGFRAALYLTPLLWASIGEVVVAARNAMKWLQDTAGRLGKFNEAIEWISPDGFPCYQGTRKISSHKIFTQLGTPFQCMLGDQTDEMDTRKQRSAIAPNFVHSMDAAHLRTTVRLAREKGIRDFALIHDDYGTHACNTDLLHECIRESFVEIYGNHDPLMDYKKFNEDRTGIMFDDIPGRGQLDIREVLKSKYFFG